MTTPAVQVTVTTEVGYCPFCRRSRTLRREERHLGGLVRTKIDCESCHRTLSSTMGVPQPKAVEAEEAVEAEPAAPAEPAEAQAAPEPAPKRKPTAKAAARKAAPRKRAATKKTRA
jgi:hypothetical protein